jgi:hypothetical protein
MPNGNPLDELLHIQPGKHYGFPPRHPKHLPNVIDEPPTAEYGPQHQSAVGMVFNEGVNGGPHFGPAHWRGDALVCGESRGKIWRTKLAKTELGYVAQNHLIACLNMLTVDNCVTPQGDLVIACHSGPPDWGAGPAGEGRLFKVRYAARELPQPVMAWASGADEFRIAFDRPLEPKDWATAQKRAQVEAGEFVSAGDRFETVRPGYQIVRDQMATPRRWVDVLGLTLSEDRRTLALRLPRQTEAVNYAISLPLPDSWKTSGGIAQHPQIDLQASLNGVVATTTASDGSPVECVLPHSSLAVTAVFAAGSAEHENFLKAARTAGASISLRGKADLSNPFVPAIQPGAKIDWDPSKDPIATQKVMLRAGEAALNVDEDGTRLHAFKKTAASGSDLVLVVGEATRHRLAPNRLFVPWATDRSAKAGAKDSEGRRDDITGNWLRGRALFFGEAKCFTCLTIRG